MKAKAIQFEKPGPASVMKLVDVDLGKPKKGEALVRHTAIGLNYIDTYQRSGLYPMPLPSGAGSEAAGVVEAVGAGARRPANDETLSIDSCESRAGGIIAQQRGGDQQRLFSRQRK